MDATAAFDSDQFIYEVFDLEDDDNCSIAQTVKLRRAAEQLYALGNLPGVETNYIGLGYLMHSLSYSMVDFEKLRQAEQDIGFFGTIPQETPWMSGETYADLIATRSYARMFCRLKMDSDAMKVCFIFCACCVQPELLGKLEANHTRLLALKSVPQEEIAAEQMLVELCGVGLDVHQTPFSDILFALNYIHNGKGDAAILALYMEMTMGRITLTEWQKVAREKKNVLRRKPAVEECLAYYIFCHYTAKQKWELQSDLSLLFTFLFELVMRDKLSLRACRKWMPIAVQRAKENPHSHNRYREYVAESGSLLEKQFYNRYTNLTKMEQQTWFY